MTLLQVNLARDCMETPWGFRLQGGKDVKQPLVVQRVFACSPSERELQRGDLIVAIGGRDTSNLTHKQAQDAISKGGGQIELLVSRPPPGQVHIKPLSPTKDTRAPAFPQVPTKAPQIVIPIQKAIGQQHSPRVIPVSPQKPPHQSQSSPRHAMSASNMAAAGHIPTKITLNKYGGGNMDFGYSPSSQRAPPATSYRPVAAPVPVRDTPDYGAQSHVQFSAPQQQFSPPALTPEEERGVSEEEYGGVSDRRRLFLTGDPRAPHLTDDYDYPTAPVNERKKLFGNKRQPRPQAVNRTHKPLPNYGRAASGEASVTFGLDFSKPQPKSNPKPTKTRERPPAVNARRDGDDVDSSWSNTLRGEGGRLKPWELEALDMEKYQGGTVDQPYRPSMAPVPAPKPKITQITAQSRAHPPQAESSVASQQQSQQQQPKQPLPLGERDWSNSHVYQMIHSSRSTTNQDGPGGQPVTHTRVTEEKKFPGQEPQRTVTETVTRGGVTESKFDDVYGISDF